MPLPWVALASTAGLPVGAFADPAVAAGCALADAGEGGRAAAGVAAEGAGAGDAAAGGVAAVGACAGPAVAGGVALAGAGEDDPGAGVATAEAVDVPPRLVT